MSAHGKRYRAAREELAELGCDSTIEYLARMCELVLSETGLLPHVNPGMMTREDFALLRPVSASMGLMLETTSLRLSERGGPHFGSPDKLPEARLETIRLAGELAAPPTAPRRPRPRPPPHPHRGPLLQADPGSPFRAD